MDRIQAFFDDFFAWLPNLLGAILILVIAYIAGKLIAGAIRRIGRAWHVDKSVDESVIGDYKQRTAPTFSVTNVIARITFWFVFGIGILLALATLQIPLLGNAIAAVVAYLPNVIAALLILVVGVAVAGGIGALASRLAGDTLIGRIVETAVPVIIVAIAITMALVQLQIAPIIVTATYIIVLGAVALGLALAFGLGGRSVASDMLSRSYGKAQERMPEMQQEAQMVKERATTEAQQAREKVEERIHPQGDADEQRAATAATAEPIEARMTDEERARLARQKPAAGAQSMRSTMTAEERARLAAEQQTAATAEPIEARMTAEERARLAGRPAAETEEPGLTPTRPELEATAEEWEREQRRPPEEPPEERTRRVA